MYAWSYDRRSAEDQALRMLFDGFISESEMYCTLEFYRYVTSIG